MNALEYMKAHRDLLAQISPEEFLRADNYTQAAMRMTEAHAIEVIHETISSVNEAALRLAELYPDGMPLTFKQLSDLEKMDPSFRVPPPGAVAEWWRGL